MATNISAVTIKANPETVWEVLTKPEFVKKWQYGSELITDWKIGSDIRFKTEWEGEVFEQWGKVLEFNPGKSLKYSLFAPRPDLEDKPENYFSMHYQLKLNNDGNVYLEIIQEDNRPGAKQEDPQGEENPVIASLKSVAESEI